MRPILLTATLLAVANANPTAGFTFQALTGRDVEAKPNEAEQPPQGVPFAAGGENQSGDQETPCPFAEEDEAGDGLRPWCDPNARQYIPVPFLDINPSGKRCGENQYCKPKRRCGEHDHECRRDCECKKKDHEYFVHHYHHHHHDHGEHRHIHDHGEHHHRHHYDDRLDDPDRRNRFLDRGDECDRRYVVVKGDTCWDIASRHQLGLDALRTFNPFLDPECHIFPGQTLCLSERRLVPVPEAERAALAGEGRVGRTEEERRRERDDALRRERDEELRRLRDEEGDRDFGRGRGGGRGGERGRDREFRGFGEGEGEGRNRDRDREDFLRRFNELSGNDGIGEERGRERQGLRDEFIRRYFGEEGERGGRDGRDGRRGGGDGEDERRGREEFIRRLREHFGRGREGEDREDRNQGREDFLRELERYRGDGGEERCPEHHECRRCRDGEECRFRHGGNPCRDGHQCRRRGVERRSVVKREEEKPKGSHNNGGFKPGYTPSRGEKIKITVPLTPSGEFVPPERQGNPSGIRADADLEGWKAKMQEMTAKKCPFSSGGGEEEEQCHVTSCLRCEKFYEVRRGDIASRIWHRYGISGDELRELNPWLNDDFDIYPGDKLCVRGCGVGGGEGRDGECPYKQRCKLLRDPQGHEVSDPRCPLNGHTCQELGGDEDEEGDGPKIDFDLLGGVSDGECAGAPGEEPRPGCPFSNGAGRPRVHHVHHRGKRTEGESDADSAEAADDDKLAEEADAEDKQEVEDADDYDVAEGGEDDEDYGPPVTSSGGAPPADNGDDSEEKDDGEIRPAPFWPMPSGPFGHGHGFGQEDNSTATATESAKPAVVTGGANRVALATALCVAFASTAFAMLFA